MALVISSSAFVEGGMIPAKYTCDDRWPSLPQAGGFLLSLLCHQSRGHGYAV